MMVDALEMLANDMQGGMGDQVMDRRHPPGDGILNGNHGIFGAPFLNGGKNILKSMAGQGGHLRKHSPAGQIGIGPRLALKSNYLL